METFLLQAPSNFNRPIVARSVSEEELTGPRQVILQKSAAGESNSGKVVIFQSFFFKVVIFQSRYFSKLLFFILYIRTKRLVVTLNLGSLALILPLNPK